MKIDRLMTNICTEDIEASKEFYTSLLDLDIAFDSDWFVQLVSNEAGLEIGLIAADHEVVPNGVAGSWGGTYLTVVVDDVEEFYSKSQELCLNITQSPEMTTYGQKRMLVKSPEGVVLDISSPESS